jgi:two-component system, NtrC family, sensor kinase
MSLSDASRLADPPGASPRPEDLRELFQLFDTLPTGILLLDTEGTVLRVNQLAADRICQPADVLLGRDFFRDLYPVLEQRRIGVWFRQQAAAGHVSLDSEAVLPSPRGERNVWLGIRSFVFRDAVWGVMLVEDRSALADEEERRKRAERLASVGELAASVAHEVNNPLASIRSFAQLLARDASSPEQHRALEMIVQESMRIARVVENLLSFARQQGVSGREPVNLSDVAGRVLDLQRYALDTAGIEVRRDFDRALAPVMGEPGALQQLLLNLVVNAEQALAARPEGRLLIVRTRESSEGVVVSVIDNGPGIPRSALPHVFEFHGAESPSRGFGLGTCSAIVRDHSGHIWVESVEGKGAAFFIQFPRNASAAPAAAPAPMPSAPEQPVNRPLRILIADDEATLRLAIALFLGRRGHQVTQAADAYEAHRLAQEAEFDVALVDARMPGDGLALLEKLEAMPRLRGRTALMTGDLGRTRTSQGITTGRPYITKPFDLMDVVRLVEALGR